MACMVIYGDFSNIADTYLSLVNWLQKMLSIRFQDPIALSVVEVIVIDYQTEIVSIPYIDIIHIHQILKNRLILHGRMNLIFNHFQNKKW